MFLFKNFFDAFENGGRLVHDSFGQRLQLFTGDRLHVHAPFLRLGDELGIVHRFDVSLAQHIHPVERRARAGQHGAAKVAAAQNHIGDPRLSSAVFSLSKIS